MQYKTILVAFLWLLLLGVMSCKRLVEVAEPEFGIGRSQIFGSNEAAQAAVVNMYVQMLQGSSFTNGYSSMLGALYAGELQPYSIINGSDAPFYTHELQPNNMRIASLWSRAYTGIYLANAVLEGVGASPAVTDSLRKQMMGEAYFVRAFHFFYLVNLFGEVPLPRTTDYSANQHLPRSSMKEVYNQINADLQAAISRLPRIMSTIRATYYGATALQARVSLYQGDWDGAQKMATKVIESGAFALSQVDAIFLAHSPEVIFQLQPVEQGNNSADANLFLPADEHTPPPYRATDTCLTRFEPGDARKMAWLKAYKEDDTTVVYYPYKYKQRSGTPATEYTVVLRLAEIYLIRAEANAQLGMLTEAIQDVNIIRARAQLLPLFVGLSQEEVLAAIEQERAVELWTEWGHRFFDLKRWPGLQPYRELWPIPADQLLINAGWKQNPGY
jgi:starch-binding outer membrane protein, SusD/RagB family